MRQFRRKKAEPKDSDAIKPTKLNSSKVLVNLKTGEKKTVTLSMVEDFRINPPDKDIYYIFGSGLEARYYIGVLLPKINAGEIYVELQPKFEIWPKVDKEGVKHMAITYTPDFAITPIENGAYGRTYYVDVKGMANETFPLKHKMFDGAFPHLPPLVVIKYDVKAGGWVTLKEYKAFKKAKKAAEA